MNKKKLNQFRYKLEYTRSELLGDVEKLNHNVRDSDVGHIADISDDAARAYNRQLEGELGEQEWQKLKQVDLAIEKIDKGNYGICSHCDGIIPEARLEIVPYTEFCTQCLSEMEKNPTIHVNDENQVEES